MLVPASLLLVAIALGWRYWFARPADSGLHLSGRIEGYETDLGAKVGGRIAEVTVREGDRVTQGQVVARLDDAELRAQLAAAQASTQAAKEQVKQAQLQLQVVASQIQEAQQNRQQDQGDSQGRISQATAAIAMVREQESGTIVQVYASDLSAVEWLLGKELAYLIIGLGEAALAMTIAAVLFGLRLRGDPSLLLIGTIIFVAAAVASGLFVGVRAGNQTGAVQGTAIAYPMQDSINTISQYQCW